MNNSYNKSEAAKQLHQKAEESLKDKHLRSDSKLSETDNLKLLHELEVHQIELEMQNEELIEAKGAADEAVEKYTELFDFAPSGYFLLSKAGEILALNLSGALILGKDRSSLIKKSFGIFLSKGSISDFNSFLEDIFNNNTKKSCELEIKRDDHPPVRIYIQGVVQEGLNQCLINVIDITDRKINEDKLLKAIKELKEMNSLMVDREIRMVELKKEVNQLLKEAGKEDKY